MGWLVQSLLTQLGNLVGKRVAQIGRSSVERFVSIWGIHDEFGTTLIIKPAF